jgi:hypothetical protein
VPVDLVWLRFELIFQTRQSELSICGGMRRQGLDQNDCNVLDSAIT